MSYAAMNILRCKSVQHRSEEVIMRMQIGLVVLITTFFGAAHADRLLDLNSDGVISRAERCAQQDPSPYWNDRPCSAARARDPFFRGGRGLEMTNPFVQPHRRLDRSHVGLVSQNEISSRQD